MPETQGERLRRARDDKGMKQGHVAKEAKVTQAHLSRIENDESGVTDHTLKRIAEVIGIPFEDIVIRRDPQKNAGMVSIDDVLSSESAMVRFLNGERPDRDTYDWVRRSLAVIRTEVRRRNDELKDRLLVEASARNSSFNSSQSDGNETTS
jgi:transcriptional regulator with XRE-family HTH domain